MFPPCVAYKPAFPLPLPNPPSPECPSLPSQPLPLPLPASLHTSTQATLPWPASEVKSSLSRVCLTICLSPPFVYLYFFFSVSYATPASALTTVDVKIFRHEFVKMFRFSEARTLHPTDICILETIDDNLTHYEQENETVFLAKQVTDQMRRLTEPRFMMSPKSRGCHYAVRASRTQPLR